MAATALNGTTNEVRTSAAATLRVTTALYGTTNKARAVSNDDHKGQPITWNARHEV